MTKYERALVRRRVKCSIWSHIFGREEWKLPSYVAKSPLAVVALDTMRIYDVVASISGAFKPDHRGDVWHQRLN